MAWSSVSLGTYPSDSGDPGHFWTGVVSIRVESFSGKGKSRDYAWDMAAGPVRNGEGVRVERLHAGFISRSVCGLLRERRRTSQR